MYVCMFIYIYIVRLFSEKKFSGLKEKEQESYCRQGCQETALFEMTFEQRSDISKGLSLLDTWMKHTGNSSIDVCLVCSQIQGSLYDWPGTGSILVGERTELGFLFSVEVTAEFLVGGLLVCANLRANKIDCSSSSGLLLPDACNRPLHPLPDPSWEPENQSKSLTQVAGTQSLGSSSLLPRIFINVKLHS